MGATLKRECPYIILGFSILDRMLAVNNVIEMPYPHCFALPASLPIVTIVRTSVAGCGNGIVYTYGDRSRRGTGSIRP